LSRTSAQLSSEQQSRPSLLDDYFDVPGLAEFLDRTERSIHRWRAHRTGPPATLINGRLYFRKSSVKRWLESREEASR
jgi:Helix-turn-helix domain